MKITVLCDNHVSWGKDLVGEHGFSAFIEARGHRILFDTGQGIGLLKNAKALGIPLSEVESIVLSHGHFDHTGGLRDALAEARGTKLIAHPDVFSPKYHVKEGESYYIGIPFSLQAIEGWGAEVLLERGPREIAPGIFTTGEVPGERTDGELMVKGPEGFVRDPLLDDLSLVIDDPKGLVLILGCAHAGLLSILEHVQGLFGRKPFLLILGGTHVGPLEPERRREIVKGLNGYEIKAMAVAHCTGAENLPLFVEQMGQRAFLAHVGMCLEV